MGKNKKRGQPSQESKESTLVHFKAQTLEKSKEPCKESEHSSQTADHLPSTFPTSNDSRVFSHSHQKENDDYSKNELGELKSLLNPLTENDESKSPISSWFGSFKETALQGVNKFYSAFENQNENSDTKLAKPTVNGDQDRDCNDKKLRSLFDDLVISKDKADICSEDPDLLIRTLDKTFDFASNFMKSLMKSPKIANNQSSSTNFVEHIAITDRFSSVFDFGPGSLMESFQRYGGALALDNIQITSGNANRALKRKLKYFNSEQIENFSTVSKAIDEELERSNLSSHKTNSISTQYFSDQLLNSIYDNEQDFCEAVKENAKEHHHLSEFGSALIVRKNQLARLAATMCNLFYTKICEPFASSLTEFSDTKIEFNNDQTLQRKKELLTSFVEMISSFIAVYYYIFHYRYL